MVSVLGATWTSCVFAVIFTVLLVIIDVVARSRRDDNPNPGIMTYAVWQLVPYFLVLAGGNVIATVIVPVLVPEHVETEWLDPLPSWVRPFLYAFLGVFAFRGIMTNLSYNALGANLSVGDWIARVRGSAVAAVLAKQVSEANESHQRRTQGLRQLPETDLNANIAQLPGEDAVAQLRRRGETEQYRTYALQSAASSQREAERGGRNTKDGRRNRP